MPKKISVIFGTRPEAIKLAPVIRDLEKRTAFKVHVCATGQHRSMLDQMMKVFRIRPDLDLNLMTPDQSLSGITARAILKMSDYLGDVKPHAVLVQGDTTTAFMASLAAFYNRIPTGHVEAGLRTNHKYAPFPEEMNRVLISRLSDWHFAPTATARDALLREGVSSESIFLTGNTVIDSLKRIVKDIRSGTLTVSRTLQEIFSKHPDGKIVLVTGHRRESFGEGFDSICFALKMLADRFPDACFIYPVHLNPRVREPVFANLGDKENIHLLDPLPYPDFVALMDRAVLILTDSGGVQEEAASLARPVLVMRDRTERMEGVEAGFARLVGTDREKIVRTAAMLISDDEQRERMTLGDNPYGDGFASRRISDILEKVIII